MRRARERGSISIYVAVCLVAMGMLAAAVVPLATLMGARTARRSDELRARLAFEAGVALVRSQSLTLSTDLDSPTTVSLDGATATVTLAANDASLAKSLLVAGTATRNGRAYRYSRVIGPRAPSPFCFALFTGSDLDTGTLTSGSAGVDGDVYTAGKVESHGSAGTINGSLFSAKTINSDNRVTGRTVPKATLIALPPASDSDYQSEASSLVTKGRGRVFYGNQILTFLDFASVSDGVYPIYYYGGDLSLRGTITGRGTVFVKGNLTISGALRYASADDEVAFVCANEIKVASGVTAADGIFYTPSKFVLGNVGLRVSRGIVVTKDINFPQALSIVRDNVARDDSDEATRLRLPSYWP